MISVTPLASAHSLRALMPLTKFDGLHGGGVPITIRDIIAAVLTPSLSDTTTLYPVTSGLLVP